MTWWMILIVYLGYVGFTVAVATGTVLDGPREWMKSFTHPLNPLPFFGKLLGCSMCLGFWVGLIGDAFHNLYAGPEWTVRVAIHVASGGLVSLVSYFTDLVLRRVEAAVTDKEMQNEFIRERLQAGEPDEAAAEEGADVAAGGEPGERGGP